MRVSTRLRLLLNPTRFLRYQDPVEYVPPRRVFDSPDAALFFRTSDLQTDEIALDGSDNWIPQSRGFQRLHHPALWNRVLRSYIEGSLRAINADIERARSSEHVQLISEIPVTLRPFSLRTIETYFEFASPNPVRTVRDLESLLESFSHTRLTHRDYRVTVPGQWERNSRVFTLNVREGVELKIYAKTTHRIRLEVSHNLAKARFRSAGEQTATKARHTFSTTAGVYRLIDRLREDAAEIVNDVLRHCRNRASIPASDKTAVDLLFDIARTVGTASNAKLITDLLCHKGSISSLAGIAVALSNLKRKGILKTQDRNSRQEYVVTDAYKSALQMLQEHGSFPHLTTRKRTRGVS